MPCTKPAADVTLTFARSAEQTRTTTDAHGNYQVRLAPGVWTVHASVGMHMTPVRIVVPRAAGWRRNFSIDTGIR